MPRLPRLLVPDGMYHVTSAGCADRMIFRDVDDRLTFLTILSDALERERWKCLQLCLMGTHYHLFLVTPEPTLPNGMQTLNYRYARLFNRRYGGSGAVFKSRYGAKLVQNEGHLSEVVRYIALNPVRAGLCAAPEDWRWSSYAGTLGVGRDFPMVDSAELLQLFASDPRVARTRIKKHVDEGLEGALESGAVPGTCLAPVLGC